MSGIEEVFNELLFGSGAWLGLIIILVLIIGASERSKYAGVCFIPVSLFIGIMYFDNVAVNENFMWAGVIMFIETIVIVYMTIGKFRK